MKLKILLLLFLLFMVLGCGRPSFEDINYFTGTEGLELEFIENKLLLIVYEESTFPLTVLISNEGAFDVNGSHPGKLSLTYDSFYLETLDLGEDSVLDKPIELHGKSYFYPEGEKQAFVLPTFKAKKIKGPRESPETKIFVNLCYPYKTRLMEEVCIDTTAITHDAREQVCQAEDLRLSSQGAPIAVTDVRVEMQPLGQAIRPVFLVTIENKGSGIVLSPVSDDELSEACMVQYDKRENWNTVRVNTYLTNETLVCEPEVVRLREERGFTRCYSEGPQYSASLNYYAPLRVELDYVYSTSISKDVNIKRVLPYEGEPLPLGECRDWEISIGGKCEKKCDFCSKNKDNPKCANINIPENFSCSCASEYCFQLQTIGRGDECIGFMDTAPDYCPDPYFCCEKS